MLKSGKRIKHPKRYSESFKKEVVRLYEAGSHTVLELVDEYNLYEKTVYDWIYKYSEYNRQSIQIVEKKDSQQSKLKALEQQVKELEQIVGQKQIKIDFLDKMIDLAEEEHKIDIKKNSSTPHSGGSETTNQK